MSRSLLQAVLRRDHAIVVAAVAAIVAASWAYLLAGAGMDRHEMDGMTMLTMRTEWSPQFFALTAAMWSVMMAAMMLPSATPMILLHETISRRRTEQPAKLTATAWFVLGYVVVWGVFSLGAALLQWGLATLALLSPMMEISSQALAGSLLVAAGMYQWTPLKQSCLRKCRSPLDFVIGYWREGIGGSFRMGLRHGAYCVGCCWMLMLLLLVGGGMNVVWIAGLAAFVLVEKLTPAGHWAGWIAGLLLVVWGVIDLVALTA